MELLSDAPEISLRVDRHRLTELQKALEGAGTVLGTDATKHLLKQLTRLQLDGHITVIDHKAHEPNQEPSP
jgi:DNA-binding HxlR family transcriptional regulator